MRRKRDQYFSLSLERGLGILRLFNRDRLIWSLSQIAHSTGLNKTSAYRFANTLAQLGYLRKNSQSKLFSLGPQIIGLASVFSETSSLSEIGKPFIDDVSVDHGLTIEMAMYERGILVILYRREGKDGLLPRFPITHINERYYCTSLGKAVLAHLPQNEMMDLINQLPFKPRTRNTITQKIDLLNDLKMTRERGYAVNNEEWVHGVIAIGAPIFDTNNVIGAISFDFFSINHTIKKIENKYANILLSLAKDISRAAAM